MRPFLIPVVLAASCLFTGCLRSDAPPPRIIEPVVPAALPARTGEAVSVRLGAISATDLLRLEVLYYDHAGEVHRDDAKRWSDAPAAMLRRRLESSASAHGVSLQDRSEAPLVDAVVERFGITGSGTLQLAATVHLRCRMADGTIRITTIATTEPLRLPLVEDLATTAGALLDRSAADIWKQVRTWQGR